MAEGLSIYEDDLQGSEGGDPGQWGAEAVGRKATTDNAVAVDNWTRGVVNAMACEDADNILAATKGISDCKGVAPQEGVRALEDFFAMDYEPTPEVAEDCSSPRRLDFVRATAESEGYRDVHAATRLDREASEVAALAFASSYAELLRNDEKQRKKDEADKSGMRKKIRADRHASDACKAASKDVEDFNDACKVAGLGDGVEGNRVSPVRAVKLWKKVRNNQTLRRIMELAGRAAAVAMAEQRKKTRHGADDVVGVTTGGDVSRLTSWELSQLSDEATSDQATLRIAENRAQVYERRDNKPQGRGPVVAVLDESGSMCGEPNNNAKAIALTMALVARKQKRWCVLVAFSGGKTDRTLAIPPGGVHEDQLLDWVGQFMGGGTSCDVPLSELPHKIWPRLNLPKGKTDVVIVTDGVVNVPNDVKENFNSWKKQEKAKVTTIIIGQPKAGDLAHVSDTVHLAPVLDASGEEAAKAFASV